MTDWCNEKDATNKRVLDFIRKHLDDTKEIAKEPRGDLVAACLLSIGNY